MWGADLRRPSFQFYPGDWTGNSNLRRCTHAERGAWLDIMCLMHDQEEYGVLRWSMKEIAQAAGCSLSLIKGLASKGVLKGDDKALAEAYVYTPRSGRKNGEPVTLIHTQAGPIWYSSRMVKDEYVRTNRGETSRFGVGKDEAPKEAPEQASNPSPKPPFGDGSSSSSSSSIKRYSEAKASGTADAEAGTSPPAGMTAQEAVWALGVPLLTAAGQPEKAARSVLGKWVKGYGPEAVREAIVRCAEQQVVEPVSWIIAALGTPCAVRRAADGGGAGQARPPGSPLDIDTNPAWLVQTGYASVWEAVSDGCTEHTYRLYRDGKRIPKEAA